MKKQIKYPPGWDEARVHRVLAHYEEQTEGEAVAEDEAAFETLSEIESVLKTIIPSKISKFDKLTNDKDPYYFEGWEEAPQNIIIRYWFWNKNKTKRNKKRVFLRDIYNLLRESLSTGEVDRSLYNNNCKQTNSDGPCGYAVIIRILESLGVGEPGKRGNEHTLINIDRGKIKKIIGRNQ